MTNWMTTANPVAKHEQFPIDWIKTYIENSTDIAFDTAAPGSGTRIVVAADSDTTFGNYRCAGDPYILRKTSIDDVRTVDMAATHFSFGEIFQATTALAVSGKYCYLPSTATIYRAMPDWRNYTTTFGAVTATATVTGTQTGSRATPADKLVLLLGVSINVTQDGADTGFVTIRDTATSTERLEVIQLSATTNNTCELVGTFKKPIPVPVGYEIFVSVTSDSNDDITASAYYAEVDL